MNLTPKEPGLVPPGGVFKYHQRETDQWFQHAHLQTLIGLVRQHRDANGLPVGSRFAQEIENFACEQLGDFCGEKKDDWSMNPVARAARFAKALWEWAKGGMPVVTTEVLDARRLKCQGDDSTPPCKQWRGDRGFLQAACGKCGCTAVKQYLATEKCPLGRWEI